MSLCDRADEVDGTGLTFFVGVNFVEHETKTDGTISDEMYDAQFGRLKTNAWDLKWFLVSRKYGKPCLNTKRG